MSYNGSGTFVRLYNWVNDKNNSINITASRMDGDSNDFVNSGFNTAFCRDGQAVATGNFNLGSFRITLLGSASALTDAARVDQVQQDSYAWCGVATGTANALVLAPAPAITAYTTGGRFRFISSASANTTATTVAISGLTAKAIQASGSALAANDILASRIYEIVYDGTAFQLLKAFAVSSTGTITSITAADSTITVTPSPITTTGTIAVAALGIAAANIAASAVTNAKLANMNNNTAKGNVSGSAAAPSDLTATQLTTLINAFTSTLSGAAPASGGGTTNFLRADATWAAPAGGISTVALQSFTASGTYTPTASMKYAIGIISGGGAGGGASSSTLFTGGGGGAGATKIFVVSAADIGASKAVTIGAGGAGTAGNSGATATAGGQSSLSTLITANGGAGGAAQIAGLGSATTGGTVAGLGITGGPGTNGTGATESAVNDSLGGNGGGTLWGGGGRGGNVGAVTGGNGLAYGSGGGGGGNVNGAGGVGSAGVLLMLEFI